MTLLQNIPSNVDFQQEEFPVSIRETLNKIVENHSLKENEIDNEFEQRYSLTRGTLSDEDTRKVIYDYKRIKMDSVWYQQNQHLHSSNFLQANTSEIESEINELIEALSLPCEPDNTSN